MIDIPDLELGFPDAENYKRSDQKEMFNHIFIRTEELNQLCKSHIFFLVGEKGTGKTAYATYLQNNNYKNTFASLRFIRETEYQKFIELKRTLQLTLSDYTAIWKVIIYVLLAEQVENRESNNPLWDKLKKFAAIKSAVNEYYKNAFAPEITYAIQFAEDSAKTAEILFKHVNFGINDKSTTTFTQNNFQTNLFYIQRQFEDALRSLKLAQNHILFIDGIDIRPGKIPYEDYTDCIRGLANAIWSVNNDFFSSIKDSKGRLRVVLLIRPDIFDSLGLQNQNSKIRDNSVVLNWLTTYTDHRESALFKLVDKVLAYRQPDLLNEGFSWDYYFPFEASNLNSTYNHYSSFIMMLRYSLYRPRDVLCILKILKENFIEEQRDRNSFFKISDFSNPRFTRKYSDYLLGEVKDELCFYYPADDWEKFVNFFHYLQGSSKFTYDEFLCSYKAFVEFLAKNNNVIPEFAKTGDQFLQFLYDLNVISYIVETDNEPFFGLCFRERTTTNIAPKVRMNVRYEIHYGLMKSLDLGKNTRKVKINDYFNLDFQPFSAAHQSYIAIDFWSKLRGNVLFNLSILKKFTL